MFFVKSGRHALAYGYKMHKAGIPYTAYVDGTEVADVREITIEQLPKLWCFYNPELDRVVEQLSRKDSGYWCLQGTISR